MIQHRFLFVHLIVSFFLLLGAAQFAAAAPPSPNWQQLSPAQSPPERYYPAMTYDGASGKVVLFGGFGGTSYLNDTWTFDGATWTRIDTPVTPSARVNMQMAYDRRTHKVILFGGFDGKLRSDSWIWDGTNSTWSQANPNHSPQPVDGAAVFTDLNGRVDVFGGYNGMIYLSQMFQWNGADWQKLTPPTLP
jgi:opacity protein-like surface antigen